MGAADVVIIGSSNAAVGLPQALAVLERGGSALDAVEEAVRLVESNPEDHSVGLGGLPNLIGEVELDASIMDGHTLAAGAVGAVRRFEHPISIARKVMEELPHVFLVGEGAERFAREMGFPERDLLTEAARKRWAEGLRDDAPPEGQEADPVRDRLRRRLRAMALRHATDPDHVKGTVNVIARDARGHLASAVSTSGWAWKYPGRLGDTPVIGAGNYCDDRYGAAACTGRGEMAIRAGTARSLVLYLKQGLDLVAAGRQAMADLDWLVDPFLGPMSLVAMDAAGRHAAFSTEVGRTYAVMRPGMAEPELVPRVHVPLRGRAT